MMNSNKETKKPHVWIFTFGTHHGYSNCYIKIPGTIESSRNRMNDLFGDCWEFQHQSELEAGVKKHFMKELDINDLPHLRKGAKK